MARDFVALELPQAVFGRDRAAQRVHLAVNEIVYLGAAREQGRAADVVVQVAVADMAKAENRFARKGHGDRRIRALDQFGHFRHRHRNVVLDVGELRFGHRLAEFPQQLRFRLVLGDDRVARKAAVAGTGDGFLQPLFQFGMRAEIIHLHQQVPGRRVFCGKRVAQRGRVRQDRVDAAARQDFVGAQPVAAGAAQVAEQIDRARRVFDFDPRRRRRGGLWMQLEHRGSDDAERAFGADEQVLQVVAGVVLAQAPESVPDAAVGQDRFETQHEIARIAVAQHVDAARVGREIAADQTTAFATQAQRKQTVGFGRGLLYVGEYATRFHGHRVVERVDFDDPVHAAKRDDDRMASRVRRGRAAHAGIAALRHDGSFRFSA